jgi:diaminopimelate decarboxylase
MKLQQREPYTVKSVKWSNPVQYTPFFAYGHEPQRPTREETLQCEGVSLEHVAQVVGTPAYVYSRQSIEAAYRQLDRAFGSLPHTLCYSVKANSNLAVLSLLARLGSSFDVVSGGELDRLRRIGVPGRRIVFSGVGKSRDEIREALRYPGKGKAPGGILLVNVESEEELDVLLSEAARRRGTGGAPTPTAIRINPDVLAGGHSHISTGHHSHKFGLGWQDARRLYLAYKSSRWIVWHGITAHIGSQIVTMGPFRRVLMQLSSHVRELARHDIRLDYLDLGGGIGIRYSNETPLEPLAYARALSAIIRPLGCRLMLEPGRTLVGPAGVLLTRVLYVKESRGKTFVIVDAAMNDLIRPVLYHATHPITKVVVASGGTAQKRRVDVVGPICESGDFLGRDWPLDAVKSGDLLVVWATGAYGFVESSNYNSRPRPPEILVEGQRFRVIRRRQTLEDLVRGEC